MRNCPHCNIPLTIVDYSGFTVLQCSQCRGHLVDVSRLDSIKRATHKSQADLKAEAIGEYQRETALPIKCPKCHLPMRKQPVRMPGLTLHMDVCRECALIWLDGGELALIQLDHRTTPIYHDMQDMKRRVADLEADPARKAAFEHNLAHVSDERGLVEEALADAVNGQEQYVAIEAVLQLCLSLFDRK